MKQQNLQTAFKTYRQAISEASSQLKDAGVETPELDARLLMQSASKSSHEELILLYAEPIKKVTLDTYTKFINQRASRIPVSKILGHKPFWKNDFVTNENVLDPRPDSEILVETVLDTVEDEVEALKILELGVGSGCLILSLLEELSASIGVGVDISSNAIKVANENAQKLGLLERFSAIESNWFSNVTGEFDILISNPPYIAKSEIAELEEEVRQYDPVGALDGGCDGLDCYKEIFRQLDNLSWKPKLAVFEIGCTQADELCKLIRNTFSKEVADLGVAKDLSGNDRVIYFRFLP